MQELELLAPARNLDIGIAAIDCGADAVYLAGPAFGARQAAGNPIEDIEKLCRYAHRFGVRIFLTLNTLIYDDELETARKMAHEAEDAGVDAFIVQDLAVLKFGLKVPLHASTQCAIRTPEKARMMESLGFSRLVLERQLSLDTIRAIRQATSCELESFVHGALCVSYSGNCYLSEYLSGRSANRGQCIQACRSLYDLEEETAPGKFRRIGRNKAYLSLKDLSLKTRLAELSDAGICSFKIEGRLKSRSYVTNAVREYSLALDDIQAPRTSFGSVSGGFTPDTSKTFNRDFTSLYIDGKRSKWSSLDSAGHLGEEVGKVISVSRSGGEMTVRLGASGTDGIPPLHNGDGFAFISPGGSLTGFRGSVCQGNMILARSVDGISAGMTLYRNIDSSFEKKLEASPCKRQLHASVKLSFTDTSLRATAESEDGRTVSLELPFQPGVAENQERMLSLLKTQIGKSSGIWAFTLEGIEAGQLPLLPVSFINSVRRGLAAELDSLPCNSRPLACGTVSAEKISSPLTYKDNVANTIAAEILKERGAEISEKAYEISHRDGAELMRSKYCVRSQLGLCPGKKPREDAKPLFLVNNGRRLRLSFDCTQCEMTVSAASDIGLKTPGTPS